VVAAAAGACISALSRRWLLSYRIGRGGEYEGGPNVEALGAAMVPPLAGGAALEAGAMFVRAGSRALSRRLLLS